MIKPILRGIRTAAALPVYILGNALMVTILERRLRRETAKVQSLTVERDEVQRKLNLANGAVHQQIEVLRSRDAEVESAENEWAAAAIERDGAEERAKEAEGQLEALRSAVAEALRFIAHSQKHRDRSPETLIWNTEVALRAALDGTPPVAPPTLPPDRRHLLPGGSVSVARCLRCDATDLTGPCDGTPPVQDAPPTHVNAGPHRRVMERLRGMTPEQIMQSITDSVMRPPVEGDHPANDPVTQQWAGIVEGLTKERDALREDIRILQADKAELIARQREVVAERDQWIASLRADLEKLRRVAQ